MVFVLASLETPQRRGTFTTRHTHLCVCVPVFPANPHQLAIATGTRFEAFRPRSPDPIRLPEVGNGSWTAVGEVEGVEEELRSKFYGLVAISARILAMREVRMGFPSRTPSVPGF